MARDYARIMTSIWRNKEFRALSEQQQRAYLFLVTQPDISAAGVLPLRMRRWAEMSSTSSPDGLAQLFKELESGRFIAVDWDAEELLIRSFIRWDGGFNNPKRRPVIIRAAEEVDSEMIARHIATEFKRCGIGVEPPPDSPSGGPKPSIDTESDRAADSLSRSDRVELDDEPFPQVNSLSDTAPDTASTNRGRVPQPTTHNPQPIPPSAADASSDADQTGFALSLVDPLPVVTAHDVVAAWAEGFATTGNKPVPRLRGQVSSEAKALLEAGNDPDRVIAAARALGAKGRATLVTELAIQTTPDRKPSGPVLLPADPNSALADLRQRGDARRASQVLGIAYLPRPQPPSDTTPPRAWARAEAERFIDSNADALRAALNERSTA
jgi:hypothetical protein